MQLTQPKSSISTHPTHAQANSPHLTHLKKFTQSKSYNPTTPTKYNPTYSNWTQLNLIQPTLTQLKLTQLN